MDWSKLHRFEFESGTMAFQRAIYNELPTMARVAQDWADKGDCKYDDPEAVYQKLKEFYQEMTKEIDRWRGWLVDHHWEIAGQNGGDGYHVKNPCGLPFDKTEFESRYARKAAYATSRLQGREAAYMLSHAIVAEEEGFEHLRNEHDGAAVLGTIPESAREKAREQSGFHCASLEAKPFEEHEDLREDPPELPFPMDSQPPGDSQPSGDLQPQVEDGASGNRTTPTLRPVRSRLHDRKEKLREEKPSKSPAPPKTANNGGGRKGFVPAGTLPPQFCWSPLGGASQSTSCSGFPRTWLVRVMTQIFWPMFSRC
jgi:hypothetical protein